MIFNSEKKIIFSEGLDSTVAKLPDEQISWRGHWPEQRPTFNLGSPDAEVSVGARQRLSSIATAIGTPE